MTRRRDQTPPYEIMRGDLGAERLPGPDTGPVHPVEQADLSPASASATGAGAPVVIRVPRGFAVLAGAGIVALVVVAYWVGHAQGEEAAARRQQEESQATERNETLRAPKRYLPDRTHPNQGHSAAPVADRARDRRQAGLNYLILALSPLDEARRLQDFISANDVVTIVVPASSNLFQVIVVPGFPAGAPELRDSSEFKERMKRLGRAWKDHNENRGDDLTDMYFHRYDGS